MPAGLRNVFIFAMLGLYAFGFYNYYTAETYQKTDYKEQYIDLLKSSKNGDIIIHFYPDFIQRLRVLWKA